MLIKRGLVDFEEAKDSPIFCHGCGGTYSLDLCLSINVMRQDTDGSVKLVQFLSCISCTAFGAKPQGVC